VEAALLTFLYYVFLGWYTVYRSMKIAKKNTENHALEYENHGSHIHAAGSMLVFRYMYVIVCPRT